MLEDDVLIPPADVDQVANDRQENDNQMEVAQMPAPNELEDLNTAQNELEDLNTVEFNGPPPDLNTYSENDFDVADFVQNFEW